MAGAGTYNVGVGYAYNTIQEALDQLVTDQGASAFTATQTIKIMDSRDYRGARVSSTLNPTDTYRLVITKDSTVTPRLLGTRGYSAADWAGIYVDEVDYVDILDLEIDEFKSGIVFYKSDYGRVGGCTLHKNYYFGIEFFESDRGIVANNAIQRSAALIALVRSRETIIAHNTADNSSMGYAHCLYVDWHDGPVSSPEMLDQNIPLFYSWNNIMVSGGAACMWMPLDHEKTLSSLDGNVYFSQIGSIANLTQTISGHRTDHHVRNMVEWRRITGSEAYSSYQDPELLTQTSDGKPGPGLLPDNTSSVLNLGIALSGITVPAWADITFFNVDREGADRTGDTPSPGHTEYAVGEDFDVFQGFLGATSDLTFDEDKINGVDRSVRQLTKEMDCWKAKVAAGYFYMGDAAFYLYADKLGVTLQDITWSEVELPYKMEVSSCTILQTSDCSDDNVGTSVSWMQRGQKVWVNHGGVTLSKPITESVHIYGIEQSWESSDQSFHRTPLAREFGIPTLPRRYFLSSVPAGGGPIVITDETIGNKADRSIVPFEFNYEWDTDLEVPRLRLQGATNKFNNSHFYNDGMDWNVSPTDGVTYVSTKRPLVGGQYQQAIVTSDTVIADQTIYLDDQSESLVYSFYLNNGSRGDFELETTIYKDNGDVWLEDTKSFSAPGVTSDYEWERYKLFLPVDPGSTFEEIGSLYDYDLGTVPLDTVDWEVTNKVRFKLTALGSATSELDCLQVHEGNYLQRYTGLPYGDEMTIEYEGSDSGLYSVDDLTISPILNPQYNGFLVISNIPLEDIDTSVASGHSTVSDSLASHRLTGKLPWAKIDGPNKLSEISSRVFGLTTKQIPREVGFLPAQSTAETIECYPSSIKVTQGLKGSFYAIVTDRNGNPYAHKDMTFTFSETSERFVGSIGIREMGSPSKLGLSVTTKTDPSGAVVCNLLPAEKRFFEKAFNSSELVSNRVQLYYEPADVNHGNITLRTQVTEDSLSIGAAVTSEDLAPTIVNGELKISLTKIPLFGTTSLQVPGTSSFDVDLFESIARDYADNEFYIDYATGAVYYNTAHPGTSRVTYEPRLAKLNTDYPATIEFEQDLVDQMTSDMIVRYDAKAAITISSGGKSLTVPVVLRNPDA